MGKTKYYAVVIGREKGIYTSWDDCKSMVHGFKGAMYKSFSNKEEAQRYIDENIQIANTNTSRNLTTFKKDYRKITIDNDFIPDIEVYTDGSCDGNGYVGAKIGIGIYFGENDERNVSREIETHELIERKTNNVAELFAVREVYNLLWREIADGQNIIIYTDSTYVIQCITTYGQKNERTNWDKVIPNKGLVREIYELYKDCDNVKFQYVKAHTGNNDKHSIGNHNADRLAFNSIQ